MVTITRRATLTAIKVLCCYFVTFTSVAASSSYNNYQYDMTVPQFTPDGRLLQTEYAQAAADKSPPIAVVSFQEDEKSNKVNVLICTARRSNTKQERLIILQDNRAVVGLSGVLADSLALLKIVLDEDSNSRRWYGRPLDTASIARSVAAACQQHSFGGGIRPYGATLLICGELEHPTTPVSEGIAAHQQLWKTDPSGSLNEISLDNRLVVQGGGLEGNTLRRQIESVLESDDRKQSLATRMSKVLSTILENQRKATIKEKGIEYILEAVIVSPDRGVYKLSQAQIAEILSRR